MRNAAAAYQAAGRNLSGIRAALSHAVAALDGAWDDDAAAEAQKTLRKLVTTATELATATSQVGRTLDWYGGEILPWYVAHKPGTGFIKDGGDDEYAREFMQRLNGRIAEAWTRLPASVTTQPLKWSALERNPLDIAAQPPSNSTNTAGEVGTPATGTDGRPSGTAPHALGGDGVRPGNAGVRGTGTEPLGTGLGTAAQGAAGTTDLAGSPGTPGGSPAPFSAPGAGNAVPPGGTPGAPAGPGPFPANGLPSTPPGRLGGGAGTASGGRSGPVGAGRPGGLPGFAGGTRPGAPAAPGGTAGAPVRGGGAGARVTPGTNPSGGSGRPLPGGAGAGAFGPGGAGAGSGRGGGDERSREFWLAEDAEFWQGDPAGVPIVGGGADPSHGEQSEENEAWRRDERAVWEPDTLPSDAVIGAVAGTPATDRDDVDDDAEKSEEAGQATAKRDEEPPPRLEASPELKG
ncbi:hypothetical protein [Actinomadura flavalba]|uniref:hypothetical protein n=1 Tax=Actinomadura flavalba TaxID=1120938 RepID=UPI00196A0C96|nr:hypothetical protein [Actinomadura flavalba]